MRDREPGAATRGGIVAAVRQGWEAWKSRTAGHNPRLSVHTAHDHLHFDRRSRSWVSCREAEALRALRQAGSGPA